MKRIFKNRNLPDARFVAGPGGSQRMYQMLSLPKGHPKMAPVGDLLR